MELNLIKQQIEILLVDLKSVKSEMDRQGSQIQRDMQGLLNAMTGVVQALDKRINAIETTLKLNGILADKAPDPTEPEKPGVEL